MENILLNIENIYSCPLFSCKNSIMERRKGKVKNERRNKMLEKSKMKSIREKQ